jgi:hypothetical protein
VKGFGEEPEERREYQDREGSEGEEGEGAVARREVTSDE